jgi:hypothetical protein
MFFILEDDIGFLGSMKARCRPFEMQGLAIVGLEKAGKAFKCA